MCLPDSIWLPSCGFCFEMFMSVNNNPQHLYSNKVSGSTDKEYRQAKWLSSKMWQLKHCKNCIFLNNQQNVRIAVLRKIIQLCSSLLLIKNKKTWNQKNTSLFILGIFVVCQCCECCVFSQLF